MSAFQTDAFQNTAFQTNAATAAPAFQADAFQNDAFQTDAAAPPTVEHLHGRRLKERRTRGKLLVFPEELPPEEIEALTEPPQPSGPFGIGEDVKALAARVASLQAEAARLRARQAAQDRREATVAAFKADIERVEQELKAALEAEHAWIARLRDEDEWLLLAA